MKHIGFHYIPRVKLQVTTADVELLVHLAQSHYDATCRRTAKPKNMQMTLASTDGLLHGWRNQLHLRETSITEVEVTGSELDTLMKITEGLTPAISTRPLQGNSRSRAVRELYLTLLHAHSMARLKYDKLNGDPGT